MRRLDKGALIVHTVVRESSISEKLFSSEVSDNNFIGGGECGLQGHLRDIIRAHIPGSGAAVVDDSGPGERSDDEEGEAEAFDLEVALAEQLALEDPESDDEESSVGEGEGVEIPFGPRGTTQERDGGEMQLEELEAELAEFEDMMDKAERDDDSDDFEGAGADGTSESGDDLPERSGAASHGNALQLQPASASSSSAPLVAIEAPPVPPPPAPPRAKAKAGGLPRGGPLDKYVVTGGFFKVKFQDNMLYAHCEHPAHGGPNKCRRTRTFNAGWRPGQGRPIGHLSAWLAAADESATQMEHVAALVPSLAARRAARAAVKAIPENAPLFISELARKADSDSEPECAV